jgi:hypothetical protein
MEMPLMLYGVVDPVDKEFVEGLGVKLMGEIEGEDEMPKPGTCRTLPRCTL